MYPHLIEVHEDDGDAITINIDAIAIIRDHEIMVENPTRWQPVRESYDELKELIFDAGCHIQKADPRLGNKQLTMDDLENMFGEPVFNSNTRKWGIVGEYKGGDNPSVKIKYPFELAPTVTCYWDDLIKFPLYRMKVTE